MMAQARCMSFNGFRTDAAVVREALEVLAPMAIEAALEAEQMQLESEARRRQMIEMDLQQARYEASLAERRYAACNPENRLIAAQLERNWEATLRRVETCEARLSEVQRMEPVDAIPDFTGLAQDLEATWNAPGVDMRCRQQLLRALIKDIVADVDDDARDVILTIHWHGGQHSQVRVRKPKSGEHGQRTPEEALAIMRSTATRWSGAEIGSGLRRAAIVRAAAELRLSTRQVYNLLARYRIDRTVTSLLPRLDGARKRRLEQDIEKIIAATLRKQWGAGGSAARAILRRSRCRLSQLSTSGAGADASKARSRRLSDTAERSPVSFGNPRRRGRARSPFSRMSRSMRCRPQDRPSASTSCQTRLAP